MPQLNQIAPFSGYPIVYTVADPAAGAGFTLTIDTRKIPQLICGGFNFVTDANVADRFIKLQIMRGAQAIWSWTSGTSTPAATAADVAIGTIPRPLYAIAANYDQYLALPFPCLLDANCSIAFTVIGGQVGDQISDIRFYALRHWDIGI